MFDIQPEQARTLATIGTTGSFAAASVALGMTPSAVSQRIRALEIAVGRPVLTRDRPVQLTESGRRVVRYARQLELLTADLAAELQPDGAALPHLTLVINSDSLHTWVLDALAAVADGVRLEVLREDQAHSLELLRSGAAAAAITTVSAPVPGCTSRRLGTMRYRPMCSASFAERWFADGVDRTSLAVAPVLDYDRKDDLQDRYLRRFRGGRLDPPRHHIPASYEFERAIAAGMGWGMVPELRIPLADRRLQPLEPAASVAVVLHWQQWKTSPAVLTRVAERIYDAAATLRGSAARPSR